MTESAPQRTPQERKGTGVEKIPEGAEILDGKEERDLLDSMRRYTLEGGDFVLAGTDQGIGYKDHNEDRIGVLPKANFLVVADGMGGYGQGDVAAQILTEELVKLPRNIPNAVLNAKNKMDTVFKPNEFGEKAQNGAVFVSARVTQESNKKLLEISQCGDAKAIVIGKAGQVRFSSRDDTFAQKLFDGGVINEDQLTYNHRRHQVMDAVSPNSASEVKSYPKIPLETGDVVLLVSDGIADNFTPEEIAKVMSGPPRMTAEELYEWLYYHSGQRMSNKKEILATSNREEEGVYSDGFKSEPKEDNRALVIMEIK